MAVFGMPGGMEWVIILVIVLILFGPKRLPQLGKSLGKTMKAIRDGVDGKDDDEGAEVPGKADADAEKKAQAPADE